MHMHAKYASVNLQGKKSFPNNHAMRLQMKQLFKRMTANKRQLKSIAAPAAL